MIDSRVFTVQEANSLIPVMAEAIRELRKKQDEILTKEAEIDALELVTEEEAENELSALNDEIENLNRLVSDFNGIIDQIHSHGCFLKDVEMGLVDFYSILGDQIVYLCWKFGEDRIEHWHEVGEGYASRKPLGDVIGE